MAKYLFKEGAGKHRMAVKKGDKIEYRLLKPNEIVELTDEQFAACKDKFVEAGSQPAGQSSEELFALAEAKKKEEDEAAAAEAAKAKAEALAKAKADQEAALAAKAAGAKAAKTGTAGKG